MTLATQPASRDINSNAIDNGNDNANYNDDDDNNDDNDDVTCQPCRNIARINNGHDAITTKLY